MSDPQNNHSGHQKGISPIYAKAQKTKHRKGSSRHWDAKQAAVKVPHGLFAAKISHPVYFIHNHHHAGCQKPDSPDRDTLWIKIRKNQRKTNILYNNSLTGARLQGCLGQNTVLYCRLFIKIVIGQRKYPTPSFIRKIRAVALLCLLAQTHFAH